MFINKKNPENFSNTIEFDITNDGTYPLDILSIKFYPNLEKVGIQNGHFKDGSKIVTVNGFVSIDVYQLSKPSSASVRYKLEFSSTNLALYVDDLNLKTISYHNLSTTPKTFSSRIKGFNISENVLWTVVNCLGILCASMI